MNTCRLPGSVADAQGIVCIRYRWNVMGNLEGMNQLSQMTGFERGTKRTGKQRFLAEMLAVAPWVVSQEVCKKGCGLAPIYRTVMGLGADGADGWEASKAMGLR